jgi:hypothetical protein
MYLAIYCLPFAAALNRNISSMISARHGFFVSQSWRVTMTAKAKPRNLQPTSKGFPEAGDRDSDQTSLPKRALKAGEARTTEPT